MRIAFHLRRCAPALLLGAALLVGCASPRSDAAAPADVSIASAAVRAALAPTGSLRIAVYAGSPTSLVRRPGQRRAARHERRHRP